MVSFVWVFGCAVLGALAGSYIAPENVPVILGLSALCGASGLAIAKSREKKAV